MMYYRIEPEVAGGWGPNTVVNRSVVPIEVDHLHYVFDGWLGDVLLETTPCFIITKEAADRIVERGLTGFRLSEVEVSVSALFQDVKGAIDLPKFCRFVPTGTVPMDDFALGSDLVLIVSERALRELQACGLNHAEIEPF